MKTSIAPHPAQSAWQDLKTHYSKVQERHLRQPVDHRLKRCARVQDVRVDDHPRQYNHFGNI